MVRIRIRNAAIAFAAGGLAIALTAPGCGPERPKAAMPKIAAPRDPGSTKAPDPPAVKFKDITAESGVKFVHVNGMAGQKLLPETMGAGVAFLDIDNDGDMDLFLVNSCYWEGKAPQGAAKPTHALYRNDGKGKFEDITAGSGLEVTCFGQGVAVGDYDNDGDSDLYVTALDRGYLYRNDGKGKFEDVSESAGAIAAGEWQSSAAFFDMENDGDLDLYICRYVSWNAKYDLDQNFQLIGTSKGRAYGPPTAFKGTISVLLRNDGGKFTETTKNSGIEVRAPGYNEPYGKSLGVAPFDVDGDGLVDLAVANDTVPNFFFHNLGQGKFEEKGVQTAIGVDQQGRTRGAMGIDWADFRNDGSIGLAIGNFANEMCALYVADMPASLSFSDQANLFGLGAPTQPPLKFGLFFFDYDLDGRLDLLLTNGHLETDISKVQASETYKQSAQLYWNSGVFGRQMFIQVPAQTVGSDLFQPIVGRGSAYADIDGDGDLDAIMTVNGGPALLLRNDGGDANHWLRLKLVGKTSNRDGIGAKVEVKVAETTHRLQHFPAKGYLSSSEPILTIGLGAATKADSVTVKWPSGQTTELKDVKANQVLRVAEE